MYLKAKWPISLVSPLITAQLFNLITFSNNNLVAFKYFGQVNLQLSFGKNKGAKWEVVSHPTPPPPPPPPLDPLLTSLEQMTQGERSKRQLRYLFKVEI